MIAKLKKASSALRHFKAELFLLIVTFFWATTFIFVKDIMDPAKWGAQALSANNVIMYRFTLCAIIMLVWKYKSLKNIDRTGWIYSILFGVLFYIAYITQTWGLRFTTSANAGFITALSVVMVPFLSIVIEKKLPGWNSFTGAFLACAGLYFLVNPFSSASSVNIGDFLCLICAVSWGIYIVLVSFFGDKKMDPYAIITILQCVMSVCSIVYFLAVPEEKLTMPGIEMSALLLYLTILCTFLPTLVQVIYQRDTTSTRAAIIYSTESLLVAILSFFLLNERLSKIQIFGGLLIITGVIIAEIFNSESEEKTSSDAAVNVE